MNCYRCGSEDVKHLNFGWSETTLDSKVIIEANLCEPCFSEITEGARMAYGVADLGPPLSREDIHANADERNKLRALLKKWGQPSTWPDKWKTDDERKKDT